LLHPVVDVLDHSALSIEAKHRGAREGLFPSALGPAGPPLDRRPITRRDGSAEGARDRVLEVELATRVTERSSRFRIAHRVRPVDGPLSVELRDGLFVLRRPRAFPRLGPPPRCFSHVHRLSVPWRCPRLCREPATGGLAEPSGGRGRRPPVALLLSAHRLEVVTRHVVGDVPTQVLRLQVGGAEVQPRPDARLSHLAGDGWDTRSEHLEEG
jgi:hypothetical protein